MKQNHCGKEACSYTSTRCNTHMKVGGSVGADPPYCHAMVESYSTFGTIKLSTHLGVAECAPGF